MLSHVEREEPSFQPGDRVQLPSGGHLDYLTVDQCGKAGQREIRCLWYRSGRLIARSFDARMLWLHRATHDKTVRVDPGDVVRLRSGGEEMTVTEGGTAQVRCVLASGEAVWLDARTLQISEADSMTTTAEELVAFGLARGVDLTAIFQHWAFACRERFVYYWRKSKTGVVYYSLQGRIDALPAEFAASASAFYGMWGEAGFLEDIEKAFAFLKAWLLDGLEVDALPPRKRTSWGL